MINKKILAASIAAAFTMNANAAIDLNDADTALTYATETIVDGGTIAADAALNLTFEAGLNLPAGTEFFVRVEVTNAVFDTISTDASLINDANTAANDVVSLEGGIGDEDFVVFSYNGTAGPTAASVFTFTNPGGLTVTDTSLPVTFAYKLYQSGDSLDALNGTGTSEVASTTLAGISFASGQDVAGSFTATNLTALVSSQFTEFSDGADGGTDNDTITAIGAIAYAVDADVFAAGDSASVDIADVYTAASGATLTGSFTFGEWTFKAAADCTGASTAITIDEDLAGAVADADADYTAQWLCVDVSGLAVDEIIPKLSTGISVSLDDNTGVSGTLGTISYDTTSISVPHITNFENSSQKLYIVNAGGTDASYTTTFTTEAAITATAGTGATGTVPAGEMMQIQTTDLVTFTGGTRGSATIEIEAEATNILATSQLTNTVSKGSDITILVVE
jgi:hypothetical protein